MTWRGPRLNRLRRHASIVLVGALSACAAQPRPIATADGPPAWILGSFVDDYGNAYTISATEWLQGPSRYHVARWGPAARFLIARNDSANASDGGRWTRIDWIPLSGMAPWTWAFCYTAYHATSAAEAESTPAALPDTPRTGCNGFPFSRMRRTEPGDPPN
jgi:hypothetical protein